MNKHTETKATVTKNKGQTRNILISDFSNVLFQNAFKNYFKEFGVEIKNWDVLFKELTEEGGNKAYVRIGEDEKFLGFILFKIIQLSNGFFDENLGFIREFWGAREFRNKGYGSELIKLAERFLKENQICKSILTTDTAEHFYETRGYYKDCSYTAKNQVEVFVKVL